MTRPSQILQVADVGDDERPAPAQRIPSWAQSIVDDVAGIEKVVEHGYTGVRKLQRSGAAWILAIAAIVVLSLGFAAYVIVDKQGDSQRARDEESTKRHSEIVGALSSMSDRLALVEDTVRWIITTIPEDRKRRSPPADTASRASPMFSPE